jgi:hypothetical protein
VVHAQQLNQLMKPFWQWISLQNDGTPTHALKYKKKNKEAIKPVN